MPLPTSRSHGIPEPGSLSVGVISDDPDFLRELAGSLDLRRIPLERALLEPERMNVLVAVLDARSGHRHLEAARLVASAQIALVVYGPADDPHQSMRYLDLGADDYVSIRTRGTELEARIRAAGRYAGASDDWLVAGPVSISLSRQEVRRDGQPVHLTPNEYRLLEALASSPGEIVTHRELMARIWGPELLSAHHYLRVYVRQLREKLEDGQSDTPQILQTVPGSGYRLNAVASEASRSVG